MVTVILGSLLKANIIW